MLKQAITIGSIPAILWGPASEAGYIFVHGQKSKKEEAEAFAAIAERKGYQVISFDLPEHGERQNEGYPCTVQNAVHDLGVIKDYVTGSWRDLSLFGSSLGAYFSLVAYQDLRFGKCLFQSPIFDMENLIQTMMKRANVTEAELQERQEIITPLGETLSWSYYSYVKENPIVNWGCPTHILIGADDELTPRNIVDGFVRTFHCRLEVIPQAEHYLHTGEQLAVVEKWLNMNI